MLQLRTILEQQHPSAFQKLSETGKLSVKQDLFYSKDKCSCTYTGRWLSLRNMLLSLINEPDDIPAAEWGGLSTPLVRYRRYDAENQMPQVLAWRRNPKVWDIGIQRVFRLRFSFKKDTIGSYFAARITIERIDKSGQAVSTIRCFEHWINKRGKQDEQTRVVNIAVFEQIFRFRVTVETFNINHQGLPPSVNDDWDPPQSYDYTAFVHFIGDFTLRYIPMTILYCPPGQDMTNTVIQSDIYGTNTTFGTTDSVTTRTSETASIGGGVKIFTGGISGRHEEGNTNSQAIENQARNRMTFSYTWNTKLIADNNRVIGRAYWGPLGDIFVLVENPVFTLFGDEEGISLKVNPDETSKRADVLILPAHRLLRPDNDPVASRIPPLERKRILALDPFLTNLDDFLPEDKGYDLDHAVDLSVDPSAGNPYNWINFSGNEGSNRAELLGRYGISTGVVIDISSTEKIAISDEVTTETVYYSEVTDRSTFTGTVGFVLGGFIQASAELGYATESGEVVRIGYQESEDLFYHRVMTAACQLIRNQNAVDLRDIELWYDKQFSTFMFRPLEVKAARIIGTVTDNVGNLVHNTKVEMLLLNPLKEDGYGGPTHFATFTNSRGQFAMENITIPGKYELKCGNKVRKVTINNRRILNSTIQQLDFNNTKKSLNLRTSPLWELAAAVDATPDQARRLQLKLNAQKSLDLKILGAILREEGLSDKKLLTRAKPVFESKISLRKGSTGFEVKRVQVFLKNVGLYRNRIDGDFGIRTAAAVKSFQKEKDLKQDGIIGSRTWLAVLENAGRLRHSIKFN